MMSGSSRRPLRRILTPLAFAVWLALTGSLAGVARAADGAWVKQTSGTTQDLNAVFFVNSTTGWAVGKGATVVHTADRGVTWTAQSVPVAATYNLTGVDFIDSRTGWISADGPTAGLDQILRTQDGGATWGAATIPLSSYTSELADVDFVDAEHGVAGGFWANTFGFPIYSFASSGDGGATWICGNQTSPVLSTNDVAWADATNVWACGWNPGGNDPALFHSSDAGAHWGRVATDVNSAPTTLGGFAEVDFVDATHGWTVAPWIADSVSGNGAVMLYTADGGATWSHRHWSEMGLANTDLPNTIDFIDRTHGWMATGSSTRLTTWRTADGGLTWQSVAVPGIKGLADLDFVSESCGWAVGSGGAIFRYTIPTASISKISPTRGKVGITLTISGKYFGAKRGTSRVLFATKGATKYLSWSASRIKVRVPTITKGRKAIRVVTTIGKSNAKYFTRL